MGWDALRRIRLTREQMAERRLQAARDLKEGMTEADVARKYGVSPVSAWRWHQTLQREGIEGLRLKKAKGAEPRLDATQKKRLAKILEEGPTRHGWATELWSGKRVAEVIRKEFRVHYHRKHIPRLLRQLGFRPRKPERQATQKDEAKKHAWLRVTWERLKKT